MFEISAVSDNDRLGPSPVGLLIPCFNAGAYLPELFASISGQTVPFGEVICYDDGSTDDTADVAAQFGAQVIRGSENRGAGFARNRLLELTKCEWVHFHDADDLLDHEFVEIMGRNVYQHKKACLCGMRIVDRDGRRLRTLVSYESINRADDLVSSVRLT